MSMKTIPGQSDLRRSDIESEFSAFELKSFEADGFVVARNLLDIATRERMLQIARRDLQSGQGSVEYEAELGYPGAPESMIEGGGRTVRRLKQCFSRDPIFAHYLARPEFVRRLEQLPCRPIVMPLAHHNCIMTKQPRFSSDTGWHQDIRYWSFKRPELVSVWLALGEERPENGCLRVIPESHRLDIDSDRLDDELFLREDLDINRELIEQAEYVSLEPGDVLFFHCRLFHSAQRNRTRSTKYSVVFTFRPSDTPPIPGSRSASLPEVLISEKGSGLNCAKHPTNLRSVPGRSGN